MARDRRVAGSWSLRDLTCSSPDRYVVSPAVVTLDKYQDRCRAGFVALNRCQSRSRVAFVTLSQYLDRSRAGFVTLNKYQDRSRAGFVTLNRYQDRSGAGFVTLNRYQGRCRGQGRCGGRISGVAGTRDVAVAGSGTWHGSSPRARTCELAKPGT